MWCPRTAEYAEHADEEDKSSFLRIRCIPRSFSLRRFFNRHQVTGVFPQNPSAPRVVREEPGGRPVMKTESEIPRFCGTEKIFSRRPRIGARRLNPLVSRRAAACTTPPTRFRRFCDWVSTTNRSQEPRSSRSQNPIHAPRSSRPKLRRCVTPLSAPQVATHEDVPLCCIMNPHGAHRTWR